MISKRLLVIGNGFDLAHKLPTSYVDFLCFCSLISGKSYKFPNDDSVKEVISLASKSLTDEILKIAKDNQWLNYFYDRYTKIGKNWIDFENEIKKFCQKVIRDPEYKFSPFFYDKAKLLYNIDIMKREFADLILLLNIYLNNVQKIKINCYYKQVFDFYPNRVINFNYTNTFNKVYDMEATPDFVHGKSKLLNNTIVLGVDTFEKTKYDIHFAEFIKYFQMVRKKLELDTYREIQHYSDNSIDTLFFGHSMDKNDGDIITTIIKKSKRVFVLYHNDEALDNIIKNLLEVYDKNEFMTLCLSKDKKIFLVSEDKYVSLDDKYKQLVMTFDLYHKEVFFDSFISNVNPINAELGFHAIRRIYEEYFDDTNPSLSKNPNVIRYLHVLSNRCDEILDSLTFTNETDVITLRNSIKDSETIIKGEPLLSNGDGDNDIY